MNKKNKNISKGVSTDANEVNLNTDVTNSDSDSVWKSPSKLKEEVQTIIDIMGPTLSPKFNYNTSSEADNEESIFSNYSAIKYKAHCDCNDDSQKTDAPDIPSNDDVSRLSNINTTSNSATVDENSDPKNHLQFDDNVMPHYICPPPLLPANIAFNSECVCPHIANMLQSRTMVLPQSYLQDDLNGEITQHINKIKPDQAKYKSCSTAKCFKDGMINWLKLKVPSVHKCLYKDDDYSKFYKMDVKKTKGDDKSPPRRVVFELVQGIPSKEEYNNTINTCKRSKHTKNTANEKIQEKNGDLHNNCESLCQENNLFYSPMDCPKLKTPFEKTTYCDSGDKTRVDVYYFDHGCFSHYRTTDAPPLVHSEALAIKTERHTTKFWAEVFGAVHIGFSFITSFLLQLLKFVLYSICRPLTIGLVQITSDYLFKPLLATCFNGIIQPILIFFFNIASSVRDLCNPIAEGLGYFLRECALLLKSIRIVEVNKDSDHEWIPCKKSTKKSNPVC